MSCDNCPPSKDPECDRYLYKTHEIVDTIYDVSKYHNALVVVRDEGGAVYHTDIVGNPICVSKNTIFVNNYTPVTGDYIGTTVIDMTTHTLYVFDNNGYWYNFVLAQSGITEFNTISVNSIDSTNPFIMFGSKIFAANGLNLSISGTAPLANSSGTSGDTIITSSAIYICIATNSWKKVALTTI